MIAADHPGMGGAKLLAVDAKGRLRHLARTDLGQLLRAGDLVVANDAATLPASLMGTHVPSGAPIEVRLAGWGSSPAERGGGGPPKAVEGAKAARCGYVRPLHHAAHGPPPPSRATWEEPGAAAWLSFCDPRRFVAIVFGAGDYRTRTEDRPPPPILAPGDRLSLGPLAATVERILGHPRLVALSFKSGRDAIWAGLAGHGRPIQYAHVAAPLDLWDIWTKVAALPVAFEPPSAGFALDWRTLAAWRSRGVGFATLTHAAGLSSIGDPALDARLPFDEPYRIPPATADAIARTRSTGGRIVAIGTTVVRALESAVDEHDHVPAGDGVATGRIGPRTRLLVVDAILSGVHEAGESHYELLRAFAPDTTLARMADALAANGYRNHEFGDSVLIERRAKSPARRSASSVVSRCADAACYSTTPMIGP